MFRKFGNNALKVLRQISSSELGKCHFMVTEGIVLGHKISTTGLEVDQAKVAIIKTLLPPTTVKGIRSFLGHAGFYRIFIKDFSKFLDHYADCWKKMQRLSLINHAKLHLKKLNLDWLQLPSW